MENSHYYDGSFISGDKNHGDFNEYNESVVNKQSPI